MAPTDADGSTSLLCYCREYPFVESSRPYYQAAECGLQIVKNISYLAKTPKFTLVV